MMVAMILLLVVGALLHIIVEDLTMYIDIPAIATCIILESMSIVPILSCNPIEGIFIVFVDI
jgi:hypothetical protein